MSQEVVEDYRYFFDERAVILEFEAELSREEAETAALSEIADMFAQKYPELSREGAKLLISLIQ
jgi:hypothetical protein